jgi:hypothetical protein
MASRGKTPRSKNAAKKPKGLTKRKVKRVAREAKASLDAATHDAGLALRRTGRKLQAKFEEAKGPAKRRARRVKRGVGSALEGAGESISAAVHQAKLHLASARRKLVGSKHT